MVSVCALGVSRGVHNIAFFGFWYIRSVLREGEALSFT